MQTAEVTWFAFLYKSEWRFRQAIIKKSAMVLTIKESGKL